MRRENIVAAFDIHDARGTHADVGSRKWRLVVIGDTKPAILLTSIDRRSLSFAGMRAIWIFC